MNQEFYDTLDTICENDVRYRRDAYEFVMEALAYTQKKFKRTKHVTGVELLKGLRELLLRNFGPMTLTILQYWGIKSTEDFGNIVFTLVSNRILSKTEEDSIQSFKNGYDFKEVFGVGYKRQLEKKISRMR